MERHTFSVEEMGCTGCERSVETALRRVRGVTEADADFHSRTVDVVAAADVSAADLRTAIEGTGYEVTPGNA